MRNFLLYVCVAVCVLGSSLAVDSVAQSPQPSPQTAPPPAQVEHPPGPRVPEPKPSGWQDALRWLFMAPSGGIRYYREGRFSAAFSAFLRGYSRKEHADESGFNLALAAHRLGLWDKAEGLWRKFITSSSTANQALVHYNLGNALVASGKLAGALAAFKRALELDPKLGQAARNLRYTQKLKEHLDRKARQSKQQQKSQQKQGQKQDQQQQKQGQKRIDKQQKQPQQQPQPQGKNQKPDKDGKNEAQDPKEKADQDSAKGQDKNSDPKDDKDKSNTDKGDDKDGLSKDKSRSQRKKTWQQQKSLNQRNSERLLESIEEDRKNYLKRKLRPSSRNQSGGKTW